MPKDVQNRPMTPMERSREKFDAFPFHIWRNDKATELRIAPRDRVIARPTFQEAFLFRCTVSFESQPAAATTAFDVRSNPTGVLDLRIHKTLLNVNFRASSSAATQHRIRIDDAIVGELAVSLMTCLPLRSQRSYVAACMTKLLCARLGYLQAGDDGKDRCGFEEWQLSALMEALAPATGECASVSQIARRCRLSVCHFSKLFKTTYGMPLHRYRIHQRIKEAKSRLQESSDPISQIALDCGFADQSSFTRRFTAITGVPPRLWRRSANPPPAQSNSSGFAGA
ncbi:AraC-type DNA-binding protein [Bryocella elongata]|uniref:AraC-type DNA-binding protein n=2 Tax=Bryocella elongata TaxID=863522 RepID=A0A1H6BS12_9BACT|nr:AraC-type DNA-binding protein [Bryocella elongata]